MSDQLEKLLQEAFGDLDNLSAEKMKKLIQEAAKVFTDLQEKTSSSDPKDREEALKTALSLKGAMQAQTEELGKLAGIDPEILLSLASDQEKISPETMAELNSTKREFQAFRKEGKDQPKKSTIDKKHKAIWIPG